MPFKYTRLEEADSIRLLVLQPASDPSAELRATLTHAQLGNKPIFEAISYAWGDPLFSHQLHVADGTLQITSNLSRALGRFRQVDSPRTLWADQISINQEDKGEKGHQVGMMSKIYKSAEKVLIWLGDATTNTKPAVDFMEEVAESYGYSELYNDINMHWWRGPPILKQEKSNDAPEIVHKAKTSHVEDIYARDWFSRLWVVQEAALARRASLYCGEFEVNWTTFGSAMSCLQAALNNFQTKLPCPEGLESARNIIDIRQHYGDINETQPSMMANKYQHFGIYMHKLRKQKCSDDRDRVYALYGLKPFYYDLIAAKKDPGQESFIKLEVDYDKPAFLVYREWALDLMSTGDINFILDAGIWQRNVHIKYDGMEFVNGLGSWPKGLWIKTEDEDGVESSGTEEAPRSDNLVVGKAYKADDKIPVARASITPPIPELPSWVPDLSNLGKKSYSLPWTNEHGSAGFQARSKAGLGGIQFVKLGSEGDIPRRIWVQAVVLGEISSRLAIHEWDESQKLSQVEYMLDITTVIKMLFKRFVSDQVDVPWPIEEDMQRALARTVFADGSGTVCQAYQRANNLEPAPAPDGTNFAADPEHLVQMWQVYEPLWEDFLKEIKGEDTHDRSDHAKQLWSTLVSICLCLLEALEGHNFFLTDKRFIGLAPLVAKEGDIIALIDSVRTPVVLRSVRPDGAGDEGRGYIVVGPCYTHGVMYGETLPDSGSPLAQEGKYIPLI